MISSSPKTLELCKVLFNRPESHGYYRMGLACAAVSVHAAPGQFVTLHLPGVATPLLRRPFSIHRRVRQGGESMGIEILYKVVGDFTDQLTRLSPGDWVDVLGPLGKGFTVSAARRKVVLASGGIGVAPLVFLAESLWGEGVDAHQSLVCLGGRSSGDILCADRFTHLGYGLRIATDDGSAGEQGLVTTPLEDWLSGNRPDIVYACGPMPMLRAVAAIAASKGIACEVSIETIMACGLGACLGCAVNKNEISGKYQHVCIDGPVFDAAVTRF